MAIVSNNARDLWLPQHSRPYGPADVSPLDNNWRIVKTPPGGLVKSTSLQTALHSANMSRLRELRHSTGPDRYELHTDGSLEGNSTETGVWGGGAFIVHEYRDDVLMRTLHTGTCHSSESSASYTPEQNARNSGVYEADDSLE